jgi:diguanylate cyclase (GGDEF)-like protein/PAS domain S-box-containing protein
MPYASSVSRSPSPRTLHRFARALLLANLAVAFLLTVAVTLALRTSHQAFGEQARTATENIASTLSLAVLAELRVVDNALLSVRTNLATAGGLSRLDRGTVSRILDEQKSLVPWAAGLRIADAEGIVRFGHGVDPTSSVGVADRPYFTQARDQKGDAAVLSEPLQSRIDKRWGVALARALTDADGNFVGVVYALLPKERFEALLGRSDVGQHGAVTLRHASLQMVARVAGGQPATTNIGSAQVSAELAQALKAAPQVGFFTSRTALDGVERVNAYQRVGPYPLMVLAGFATAELYAPWWRHAVALVTLALLILTVLGGSSVLLLRSRRAELAVRRELDELARAQGAMLDNDLVAIVRGRDRKAVWVNRAMERIFGYEAKELLGQSARLLHADDASYASVASALGALADGKQFRTQVQMRRKDGESIWVDLSGTALSSAETLWMMADITALKRSEELTRHAALHDGLTGLPNRTLLAQRLESALTRATAAGHVVALALVDLDGFKAVNDRCGHAAGDAVLSEAARRLQLGVRGHDTVARWGGDEFVVVLTMLGTTGDSASTLQRLLTDLQRPMQLGDGVVATVGASIGVAFFPSEGKTAEALIQVADQRMYGAKRGGRNRIVDADPTAPSPSVVPAK